MAARNLIKRIYFTWGPPPTFGRPDQEERKVYYVFSDKDTKFADILEKLAVDIMPKGWLKCLKTRHLKIFDQDGFRITNLCLLENERNYYVDFKFPRKIVIAPKPAIVRRIGCASSGTAPD